MSRFTLCLVVLMLPGCASSAGMDVQQVEVTRLEDGALPTSRSGCEYLGQTEIRTNLGDRTETAFSWDASPKFANYVEALRKKAARQGANAIILADPQRAEFGAEGLLRASMFDCAGT